MASEENQTTSPADKSKSRTRALLALSVVILLLVLAGAFMSSRQARPLQMDLGDGRIFQIEGITYGTNHTIGHTSMIYDRLGFMLPRKVRSWLEPSRRESKIVLDRPALVVWANAIDPRTRTNVDCQQVRAEFVAANGDLIGADTSSWSGGLKFWRVGHIFYSYPRNEQLLTLQVTSWKTNKPCRVQFANPHVTQPAQWQGSPLPQTQTVSEVEIVLKSLKARTNGGPKRRWETPAPYWEPELELRSSGKPASGWSKPEWVAEDPLGNKGRFPGIHQAVLRFSVTFYPEATNLDIPVLIGSLPEFDPTVLTNACWWNKTFLSGTNTLTALGILLPGTHVFSGGQLDTNGPSMGPVYGGAPSGWVGTSRRISPVHVQHWDGHYTPSPTIYIRVTGLDETERLAVRLRDGSGHYWPAKSESQGSPQGIHPFLIELPHSVTNVVPELVLLRPAQAEFLVKTTSSQTP